MKHCVLITAYKDAPQINRLISRIPEDWGIFIHLYKKSEIKDGDIDSRAIGGEKAQYILGKLCAR